MPLITLKDVTEIGGFPIVDMDKLREQFPEKFNESGSMNYEWFEKEIRPNHFIYIRHDVNSISFTLQNGPVKLNGVYGCQVETIIDAAKLILEGLNAQYPCHDNELAINKLDMAIRHLQDRTRDRIARGVEGEYKL